MIQGPAGGVRDRFAETPLTKPKIEPAVHEKNEARDQFVNYDKCKDFPVKSTADPPFPLFSPARRRGRRRCRHAAQPLRSSPVRSKDATDSVVVSSPSPASLACWEASRASYGAVFPNCGRTHRRPIRRRLTSPSFIDLFLVVLVSLRISCAPSFALYRFNLCLSCRTSPPSRFVVAGSSQATKSDRRRHYLVVHDLEPPRASSLPRSRGDLFPPRPQLPPRARHGWAASVLPEPVRPHTVASTVTKKRQRRHPSVAYIEACAASPLQPVELMVLLSPCVRVLL